MKNIIKTIFQEKDFLPRGLKGWYERALIISNSEKPFSDVEVLNKKSQHSFILYL